MTPDNPTRRDTGPEPTPMFYSAESLRLADDIGDRIRRLLKDGALDLARREGRTSVTADDVRRSVVGVLSRLAAVLKEPT
jgi:hypothetical protein